RYTRTPVTFIDVLGGLPVREVGEPFVINYKASQGGDFAPSIGSPGVIFKTSGGASRLYVPETGANAPTSVESFRGASTDHDPIFVGFDGACPTGQAQTTVRNISLTPHFPTTASGSILDFLRSNLTVHGAPHGQPTALEIDDQGASRPETYTLSALISQLGSAWFLRRTGASPIIYDEQAGPAGS